MAPTADICGRWEPFVDGYLIDRLQGATHRLHPPAQREVVMEMNSPWECSTSGYYNLFRDGDRVRMYYRGLHRKEPDGAFVQTANLAESVDGVRFTRPDLGVVEVAGSKDNNVVWAGVGAHNFCVFRDGAPGVDRQELYKAVGSGNMGRLYGFSSPDGLSWRMVQDEPLPIPGAFDSLNVAFWDPLRGRYRLFSRYFSGDEHRVRAIQSCESEDFLHWTDPVPHRYADGVPWEQFYTNATVPCPGAEHILLSFPKRFVPKRTRSTEGMEYPGEGLSDGVFMTSRDGVHWDRTFLEAWIRPGLDARNWSHRSNMPAAGILRTAPDEWSMYVSENYGWGTNRLRRVTVRPLGFASVGAGRSGGEMLTRELTVDGDRLRLNYSTSAAGSVRVSVCDPDGRELDGFAETEPMFGDELDAPVHLDLSSLRGKPVRLRFRMEDADVFAVRATNG